MPRPRRPRAHRRQRGFTLIEIMAVVLIMGLLAGIVGYNIIGSMDRGRVTSTRVQISALEQALQQYYADNGRFPTTEQGLDALVQAPSIAPEPRHYQAGGYLGRKVVPVDSWGNAFQYEAPGQMNPEAFDVWSLGADGEPGGDGTNGDLGNWVETQQG